MLLTDPWKNDRFCDFYSSLMELDPDIFRSKAFEAGLITDSERAVLAALETDEPLLHNADLLSYAESGGERTFLLLLQTLQLMGDSEIRQELEALLLEAGKHWNLLDYVFR